MKSKQPKYIKQFATFLSNGFMYTQVIHQTVAIYKNMIRQIEAGSKKPPRVSRTLLGEALSISKNKLEMGGYLDTDGVPTKKGIVRSLEMIGKEGEATPLMKKAFLAPFILGAACGDYVDDSFEKAKESYRNKNNKRKGSRSVSHSCSNDGSLRKELNKLRKAMDEVFSCNTAFGTCDNNSMSSGHCMLSALIIQDMYGGDIMSGQVQGIPHYWNKLCHMEVDLTGDQFKKPKVQIKKSALYGSDSFKFDRNPFESMNQDFNQEVWSKHCSFRQMVRKELESLDSKMAEKLKQASKSLKR